MRSLINVAVGVGLIILQSNAIAAPNGGSANALYEACKDTPSDACDGVIAGMFVMLHFLKPNTFCFPANAPTSQYRDVFFERLRTMPEERHMPVAYIFMVAMADKFPCR